MLDVTDRARSRLAPATVCWVPLTRVGEASGRPQPPEEAAQRGSEQVKSSPAAQAYRSWFWDLDVDPTKRRPAGEALGRRLASGGLPEIHPLVDAYNLASATTLVALSAFDRDALSGTLRLDLPQPGETLDALGEAQPVDPTGEHPVWRDDEGLVGLAAYRDARRTALDRDTDEAIVATIVPQAVPEPTLDGAFDRLERYAEDAGWRFTGPVATLAVG